jgi:RNA polymerase sigma factor (sigma-70 family)
MRDDPAVVALVARARAGDKVAWDELVERYAPLVWSICRRYGLSRADTEDVGQSVWLSLIEQLPRLRVPAALPGWIATTTRRECVRTRRAEARQEPVDPFDGMKVMVDDDAPDLDDEVLRHERNAVLREAFAQLPSHCQQLLALLIQDPPVPYQEISQRLGMPLGSIGPSRARCFNRMRQCPALAALIGVQSAPGGGG